MTEPERTLTDEDIRTELVGTGAGASLQDDPDTQDADADDTDADDDAVDDAGADDDATDEGDDTDTTDS